jgi:dTDP-4-dehydrorhamnose 3,5-epimerase
MEFRPIQFSGCYEIRPVPARDQRGYFVKTFHSPAFADQGLKTEFIEQYYSVSVRNVVRGMHVQVPPMELVKTVHCIVGSVLDVIIDLRKGSPTYQQWEAIEMSADKASTLYLPAGIAHGFLTLSESATLLYNVSQIYSPVCDTGVRWSSIGFAWPCKAPIVSDRDQALPALSDFDSPFVFHE